MLRALDEIADGLPLLITTADHPLLSAEIVEAFCAGARASGADLAAGLAAAEVVREAYPEAARTWLRFADGSYSGANLFALLTPAGSRGGRLLAPGRAGAQAALAAGRRLRPGRAARLPAAGA